VVYDRAFFDAVPIQNKAFEPLCTHDRYHELLHQADIALLPLEPTHFNRRNSDLKFIERGSHSIAALASPTVYDHTIKDGETGVIFHSPEEFEPRLERLIDDGSFRHWLGENAYRFVTENRLLVHHFRARYDWYLQMLAIRPKLDEELRACVPELRSG
jgi:hypothetical protein